MNYPGSKKRYARKILETIKKDIQQEQIIYCEAFVGGNNIAPVLLEFFKPSNVLLNDINKDLILLHKFCFNYDNVYDVVRMFNIEGIYKFVELIDNLNTPEILKVKTLEELENFYWYKSMLNDESMPTKKDLNAITKNKDIPNWQKLLLISIFSFNGLSFFKGFDYTQTWTIDRGLSGYQKVRGVIRSYDTWLNQLCELNNYVKHIKNGYVIFSDYDYKEFLHFINKVAEFYQDKTIVVYLDPPYFENYDIDMYQQISRAEFFSTIESLNKNKNVHIYISEGLLLNDDRLDLLLDFRTAAIVTSKDASKARTEFLYKVKKEQY